LLTAVVVPKELTPALEPQLIQLGAQFL
jgi:hypothetical protein